MLLLLISNAALAITLLTEAPNNGDWFLDGLVARRANTATLTRIFLCLLAAVGAENSLTTA